MKRFHKSESVNGYFKGIDGILHLLGRKDNAIYNEMHLRNALYNLIHLINMKGSID